MRYPLTLLAVAAVTLLTGLGIRMHADWRYTNKMYYHTAHSKTYDFEDVLAERNTGDTVQLLSLVAGVAGGIWLGVAKTARDNSRQQ